MANPLDRTWYNALVNDDGSGTIGTVWNKEQVDALMDVVDASLVPIVDRSGSPAAGQVARFTDGDTLTASPSATLEATQAGLTLTGTYPNVALVDPAAPAGDQLVRLVNIGSAFFLLGQGTLLQVSRSGLLTVTGGVSVANGALIFPSTPVPNAGVTTLDEYREGPWTPSITGGNGGSGVTYGLRDGTYTKIGRKVVAQGRLSFVSAGTMVPPDLYITGLPVPCGTTPGVLNFSACDGVSTSYACVGGSVLASLSQCLLKYVVPAGGIGMGAVPYNFLTNSSYLEFTAIYQAGA